MVRCSSLEDRWRCVFSNGELEAYADTTGDKGGGGNGFRPHELLEAALASCINISVRMKADEKNIELDGVTTRVEVNREPGRTTYCYDIEFEGIPEREADALQETARNCPVHRTFAKSTAFQEGLNSSHSND